MQKTILLLAALVAALLGPQASSAAAPTSSGKAAAKTSAKPSGNQLRGWFLKQNLEYHGQIDIIATDKGSKVRTKDLKLFMVPNTENLVLLNETNKTQTLVNRKVWMNSKAVNGIVIAAGPKVIKDYRIPVSPPKMIAGHLCKQHWAACFKHDKRFWYWWEYWTTEDIKLPKDTVDQYLAMMQLPSGTSLALEAARHYQPVSKPRHQVIQFLSTSEVKPIKIAESDLVPDVKGYRKVQDEMDIVLGLDQEDEISKLMRSDKTPRTTKVPQK